MIRAALLALVLLAGCNDSSRNGGAGGPAEPAFAPIQGGSWTFVAPGEPDTRMVRRDSPGGIRCWVPEVYLQAAPQNVARYLRALDEEPNEIGVARWRADNPGAGDPPAGAVPTLLDAPQIATGEHDVIFMPRIKAAHFRRGIFFRGLTETKLGAVGYWRMWLTWPEQHDDDGALQRGLIAHETTHVFGEPGSHDGSCPRCLAGGL